MELSDKLTDFGKGALHGLYTPFALNSGIKHLGKTVKEDKLAEVLGQIVSGLAVGVTVLPEYILLGAVTNVGDFMYNRFRKK